MIESMPAERMSLVTSAATRNTLRVGVGLMFAIWSLGFGASISTAERDLFVQIIPQFNSTSLVFDKMSLTNRADQLFSVTRLDFLLSDFALRRSDGAWLTQTDWQVYLSLNENRSSFRVEQIPGGRYDRVRFHVGIKPELNHSNPAQYPPDHPLNPNLNGLYWGWAGGYVFFAIEGRWSTEDGIFRGYSFHLGNDSMLMTVELPVALTIDSDQSLKLELNLNRLFEARMTDDNSSTHSREGDELATRLRGNVEQAFSVDESAGVLTHSAAKTGQARKTSRPDRVFAAAAIEKSGAPLSGTPYRFRFPSQFPIPELPRDNPLTEEGVELGGRLFSEKALSIHGLQSCASCHQVEAAFTDAGKRFSLGAEGQQGVRNTMPLFNLAWKKSFFWDGRAPSLRDQVLMPIQNPVEMHETLDKVVAKLAAMGGAGAFKPSDASRRTPARETILPLLKGRMGEGRGEGKDNGGKIPIQVPLQSSDIDYPSLFEKVFASREITVDRIACALEQFVLTQLSYNSKFDRTLEGKETLTDEEKRGFELFSTEYDPRRGQFGADCFHCHGGPLFTTHGFANNGLDTEFTDLGRYTVTHDEADQGKFAVPSLRNVELTAPYMHDGRFATLEEVIEHYSLGIKRSATLDPNLAKHPGGGVPLSAADKRALVLFLRTLTDERFDTKATTLVNTR